MTMGYSHKITVIFATYNPFTVCKAGGIQVLKICTTTLYKVQTEKYVLSWQ